ncbi:hypothetical protein OROMI_006301 [Orobanche minor]
MNKMLKPDKWQATFDTDGKIIGFEKVLKLIILGTFGEIQEGASRPLPQYFMFFNVFLMYVSLYISVFNRAVS